MSVAEPREVAPEGVAPAPPSVSDADAILPLITGCPFLASADGAWRSAVAERDHRCSAVTPPAQLTREKQRRLCLTPDHAMCATYTAARAARDAAPARVSSLPRPVARMTPVVLDHRRLAIALPAWRANRSTGQVVLVGILTVALAAIVIAKLSGAAGGSPVGGIDRTASPRPTASSPVSASSSPAGTTTPSTPATPATSASPAPSSGASPSPAPSASPTTATTGRTYIVKRGDTLLGIAARFGTTYKVLVRLNGLTNPSNLRVGQVLKLP